MVRIAVAGFLHETNTFVAGRTTREVFEANAVTGGLQRGQAVIDEAHANSCVSGFASAAHKCGYQLVPILHGEGDPGAKICQRFFDETVEEICARLNQSGPIDGVLLDLHGAMVVEGDDDGDALLLECVREAVGPNVPIICTFDSHGNIAPRTLAACDGAVAYRTYPHVDLFDTGVRAVGLFNRRRLGARMHVAHRYIPFLMPLNKQATIDGPTRDLYEVLERLELEHDLASMSLMLSFQMADIVCPQPSIFAFAADQRNAEAAVERMYDEVMSREADFAYDYISATEAAVIARSYQGARPLILADAQDSTGGGGSSDTMGVAHALLEAGVNDAVIGIVVDPDAAVAAHAAGEGAIIDLSVGGRLTPGDRPLTGQYRILALADGAVAMTGPLMAGVSVNLGPCARLAIGGLEIIVTSIATQCLDQALYLHLGVNPSDRRVVVVKDAVHFRAHFDAITGRRLDVATLGRDIMDYRQIPYTKINRSIRFSGVGLTLA